MPQTIKVLFLAAEAEPFVKIGGLGDVAGSLPRAIRSLPEKITGDTQTDIRLVLPLHPVIPRNGLRPLGMDSLKFGAAEIDFQLYETVIDGLTIYFIDGEPIHSSGSVYSLDARQDAEKYTFFSLAALELPRFIGWIPDILHANDWHTALANYGSLTRGWEEHTRQIASVITLHNLSYMGPDVRSLLDNYGIKLAQTDLPDWARNLPLPLGMWASDAVVAVSPTFAEEILTPEFGNGLEVFLQSHRASLHGILNGLDTLSFDPATDPALGCTFDVENIDQRKVNKGVLQARLGFPREPDTPLIAMVSRMDRQKGVDIALSSLQLIKKTRWQAVILGTGDPELEALAVKVQNEQTNKIKVVTRYDNGLARQIYGGADLLLMPSRYEPCGLAQMIAMRYGCIPVVRATGGLKDTVEHTKTGFVFDEPTDKALTEVLKLAFHLYDVKRTWRRIQISAMQQDFSWSQSAIKYFNLYKTLKANSRI